MKKPLHERGFRRGGAQPSRKMKRSVKCAVLDSFSLSTFCRRLSRHSSLVIANILEQRERLPVQPGPLHLARRSDLLDVELPPVDISIYDPADTASTPENA